MTKKLLLFFAGTGINATNVCDETEKEIFKPDVIRVYFNGCQDDNIGGRWMLPGYLNPDLDVVTEKIHTSFFKNDGATQLNLSELKTQFGSSIIIRTAQGLEEQVVAIEDITLTGFSRGAVTTFACAKKLDNLGTPISIFAEDPVPGESRLATSKEDSLYQKNIDLSGCLNIKHIEVLLGTYSKHNSSYENKWYRQMAPKFPANAMSAHIYMVPKASHTEVNNRAKKHISSFFNTQKLTFYSRNFRESRDRTFAIPKVEQQKFHYGVVGRTEYLPAYKESVLKALKDKYDVHTPCPLQEDSKFKSVQALLALHNADLDKDTFDSLSKTVLEDTDKGKGLREFIIEFDSIIQYSKARDTTANLTTIQRETFKKIDEFLSFKNPARKVQEEFIALVQKLIQDEKQSLPSVVYRKLDELTTLLLKENTLVHSHLVKLIYGDDETCLHNENTGKQMPLDVEVKNTIQLAKKLYHSSTNQRPHVFDKEKTLLTELIRNASELAAIASFLPPAQIEEALELVSDKVTSMKDVLLLIKTLPTYEQRKIIFKTYINKLNDMNPPPTSIEIAILMDYLSEKKCAELCKIIDIGTLSNIVGEHSELIGISKSNLIRKMCNIELVHEIPDPVHRSGAAYRLAFTDSREPIDVEEFKGFVPEKK